MISLLHETQDRVDGSYHLLLVVMRLVVLILHEEAEASENVMACPGTAVCLLTDNECKRSAFSKQIEKVLQKLILRSLWNIPIWEVLKKTDELILSNLILELQQLIFVIPTLSGYTHFDEKQSG